MNATSQLLRNNESYAAGFAEGGKAGAPAKKVAIVTCMDARLDPAKALGIELGDAHVIRNAGGVVTDDVIRSLAISQHELGTEEILVMHHTKCGMMTFTDEEFATRLERAAGSRPQWDAHSFADLEQDVRDGVRKITESPFIPSTNQVRGFVYDVDTGAVREVG
jgi:carbonic anhydrase